MGMPNIPMQPKRPLKFSGVIEINLGDNWRGVYTEGAPPKNVPVLYAIGILVRKEKGFLVRKTAEDFWNVLEGNPVKGEQTDTFLSRIAEEQAGIDIDRIITLGFDDLKATRHNTDYEIGTQAIRTFSLVIADTVGQIPEESGYTRRRLPLSEYAVAVRKRYPEFTKHLGKALDQYIIMRAKNEI
jgi:hypothetical protein